MTGPEPQKSLRALDQYGTLDDPRMSAGETLYSDGPAEYKIVQHNESARPVLLLKDSFANLHSESLEGLPATLITSFFPVDVALVNALRRYSMTSRRIVGIVGDLDPHALCQFLALSYANPVGVPVISDAQWLGVDEAWLALLRRYSDDWRTAVIKMSPEEYRFYRALADEVNLVDIVGPDAAALLDSGFKIEIEGACNPAMYREGFAGALVEHLKTRILDD